MTEKQAKKHLTKMLDHFTAGSILHLLGDVVAKSANDPRRIDQCKLVEQTLFVVGLGIDAVTPA